MRLIEKIADLGGARVINNRGTLRLVGGEEVGWRGFMNPETKHSCGYKVRELIEVDGKYDPNIKSIFLAVDHENDRSCNGNCKLIS